MAEEITITAKITVDKTPILEATMEESEIQFTWTGTKYQRGVQNVGTSQEALNVGDLSTDLGWCFMRNLDATNFVKVRPATGVADCIKLKAGECALFRFAATAPFVIADTAACDVEYMILSD